MKSPYDGVTLPLFGFLYHLNTIYPIMMNNFMASISVYVFTIDGYFFVLMDHQSSGYLSKKVFYFIFIM